MPPVLTAGLHDEITEQPLAIYSLDFAPPPRPIRTHQLFLLFYSFLFLIASNASALFIWDFLKILLHFCELGIAKRYPQQIIEIGPYMTILQCCLLYQFHGEQCRIGGHACSTSVPQMCACSGFPFFRCLGSLDTSSPSRSRG